MIIGTVTPTRNDRPLFFCRCALQMARQTRPPDHIEVVDYPGTGGIDIRERYIYGIEKLRDKCDLILFIEDDDYYPPTYIQQMADAWERAGRPVLLGSRKTRYYHIKGQRYAEFTRRHSAAFASGISPAANYTVGKTGSIYYDYELWMNNHGRQVDIARLPVGIKHGNGAGRGHNKKWNIYQKDPDGQILTSWTDAQTAAEYFEMARPQIGIVIVACETPELLRRAVNSVRNIPGTAIQIVDNSRPGSPCYQECDRLKSKNIFVHHNTKNIYHGPALHQGVKMLNTRYIVVMDSDAVVINPRIFSKMIMKLHTRNIYAVGAQLEHVSKQSSYKKQFDYLKPWFAMFKRQTYFDNSPFIHHGAPWVQTMIDIYGKLKVEKIEGAKKYVMHDGGQTIAAVNKDWLQGWQKPRI